MYTLTDLIGEGYPLKEEKEIPKFSIYCDMDGVLTDFDSRFEHFAGMSPSEYKDRFGEEQFWYLIDQKVGLEFWSKMDWMSGGRRLWDFISRFPNVQLLTSPSRHNNSRLGKNTWVRNHLSPTPKVIFAYSSDKQRYANPDSILIDDKKSNINQWASKGGIAIRCKNGNVDKVIEKLKELGFYE